MSVVGYCTNVHAGATLTQTLAALDRHSTAVRQLVHPVGLMPVGLWLSARSVHEIREDPDGTARLRDWLFARGLVVFTLNGFPYGDFHAGRGKKAVYEPHWGDVRRALYTMSLADILADLLPDDSLAPDIAGEGSISTLPLGWRSTFTRDGCGASVGLACAQIEQVARHLKRLEESRGVCIHLDLEPEPGCALDRAHDVVAFFDQCVRPSAELADPRRYVRVCHDICHSAVMFEPQADALETYRRAGIRIGKVQVSSALTCDGSERGFRELRNFDEPKYLHQTCVLDGAGAVHFYEDLDRAFDEAPVGIWRVHFHVPVDRESIGALGTTSHEIAACFANIVQGDGIRHYEVETYAWNALPVDHRRDSLAHGIADEIIWTKAQLHAAGIR